MVQRSLADGILNAAIAEQATFVLIGQKSGAAASAFGTSGEAVAAATPIPVAILLGKTSSIKEVQLVRSEATGAGHAPTPAAGIAEELASRVGGSRVRMRDSDGAVWPKELGPGELCIAPGESWQLLAMSDPPEGAAVVIVLESGMPWIEDADESPPV
jgi:hypothetical protein